jgi:hypothetical protein
MPELLTFLLFVCCILLWFNGMWDAFCIDESDSDWSRRRSNYGVVKVILTSIILIWGLYILATMQRG